jgi:hypothetical protein
MLELPQRGPLTLHYPRTTHVRFEDAAEYYKRTLRVLSIRDLVHEPLTPEEFLRRPFVRRSRYLILGHESGQFRRFYLGCAAEYRAPSQLRIALYEPGKIKPIDLLSRPIGPNVQDRKYLSKLLITCREKDFGKFVLRVFADDFGLVG